MFTEHPNLNSGNYKSENSIIHNMPIEKCFAKGYNKYDIKKINNNFEEDVKRTMIQKHQIQKSDINLNVSPPLNTMPPPPHKVVNDKNIAPLSYNRRGYWKSNFINGRSLSPLGYDSDESTKSYGSRGYVTEEHGKQTLFVF